MASLRGGQDLWTATAVNPGDKSPLVVVGPGPYVSFMIENTGAASATFIIEAAASSSPEAGRNALDGTTDGGLIWCAYYKNTTAITVTVAAGASACVDLSPFAPQFVRLHRQSTDTGVTTITAIATVFGPN